MDLNLITWKTKTFQIYKLDVLTYNRMKKTTLDLQEKLGNRLALCTLRC
jgi:hypothetical protein